MGSEKSAIEIALDEVVSNTQDSALWAEAYIHTDDDESRKKYYVRERSKVIDSQAATKLRKLGKFGWITIISFYILTLPTQIGELLTLHKIGGYYLLPIPNEAMAFFWGFVLLLIRIILFLYLYTLITRHKFGQWPIEKKLRPRFFLGTWIGLFSGYLVAITIMITSGLTLNSQDYFGAAIIQTSSFLLWCFVGVLLSLFYKLKLKFSK
jgi:hypothetical protein